MNQQARAPGFGDEIARMQDALLDPPGDLSLARQHLLRRRTRQRRVRLSALAALAVAALVAVASVLMLIRPGPPLTFKVDGVPFSAEAGAPVTAPATRDAVIRFSDGSTFTLRPHARARTTSLSREGASVLLERGSGEVSVVHRDATRWQFHAGDFRVLVTGTRFDLAFRPEGEVLSLKMYEGAVVVTGCSLQAGIGVAAGQALEVRCVHDQAEVVLKPVSGWDEQPSVAALEATPTPAATGEPEPKPEVGVAPTIAGTAASPAVSAERLAVRRADGHASSLPPEPEANLSAPLSAATTDAPADAPGPSWRELAAKGRYREAYEAVAEMGFATQCEILPAEDLLIIAEAATYSGRTDHGKMALSTTRSRFAGSDAAATAAFMLGRIAFDHQGAYADAKRWFQVYLLERPSGRLARDAMGRVIEAEQRTGNGAAARDLSRKYLELFPAGPHAALARSLLTP